MSLYAIPCRFKTTKDSAPVEGIAICSDADTPVTFVYPDGKPYTGKEIWDYRLQHHMPWAEVLRGQE